MADKLNNKLQKIELMLNDDFELDKYINEIENTQISYSNKLEEKIIFKVNKKKSLPYTTLLKMVACMVVALILCQTKYIKNPTFTNNNQVEHEIVQGNNFLDDKINQISDFFMKPIF